MWGVESTFAKDEKTGLRVPIAGETFGPIAINSLGFRGPEIDVPKPDSRLRIAFLGASTTYCAEASDNAMTWPSLVRDRLQQEWPEVSVDYVNGGVPGYTVSASRRNLAQRIALLEPDIIVIYHAINDLSVHSKDLAVSQGLEAELRTEEKLAWPSSYSLLWYLVEKNLRIMARQATAHRQGGTMIVDHDELSTPFRSDLLELVRESQAVAPVVALATFSPHLRRDQDPTQQANAAITNLYYMPYMSVDGLLDAYDAYNQVIRDVAASTDAILIDEELSIPGDSRHFSDSVHFTDVGSVLMAERVSRVLLESRAAQSVAGELREPNISKRAL